MILQREVLQGLIREDREDWGFDPAQALFLDIETTGLSARHDFLYLIGYLIKNAAGDWELTQVLAEKPQEEELLLQQLEEAAAGKKIWIHYNGNTFDLPFLRTKYRKYGQENALDAVDSLDLYQRFRWIAGLLSLSSGKLNTMMEALGQTRQGISEGKDLIPLYQKFVTGLFPELAQPLLLHNREDILALPELLTLSAYEALKAGKVSLLADPEVISAVTENDKKQRVCFQFLLRPVLPLPIPFYSQLRLSKEEDAIAELSAQEDPLKLRVWLVKGEYKHFLTDYRNYYYLPLEDQAVHKSVGEFVEKEYRQKARPATCYIRKTGLFLPQLSEQFTPIYQKEYRGRQNYFALPSPEQCREMREAWLPYVGSLLALMGRN